MHSKAAYFRTSNVILFAQAFLFCPQTPPYSTNQKHFYCTNLSLSPSKQSFSTLHFPFAPSHNLLSTKERRCSFNLRSNSSRCNARTSHRFKAFSLPFCAKNRFRHVPLENFAEIFFDRALNRPRESRGSQPSISLKHGRLAHVRSQFSLFRRSPTHKNLPLATFCTSERHSRRQSRLFVLPAATGRRPRRHFLLLTQHFSALRRCPCRDGTLRVLFLFFLQKQKELPHSFFCAGDSFTGFYGCF